MYVIIQLKGQQFKWNLYEGDICWIWKKDGIGMKMRDKLFVFPIVLIRYSQQYNR